MTDYVINEKRMNALRLELHPDIIKDLCSRPLSEHDAEIRMKERERVLRDFENWCGSFDDYTCGTVFTPSFVLKKLQSLRGEP